MKTKNAMIYNWVVHYSKCTIPYSDSFMHLLKKKKYGV